MIGVEKEIKNITEQDLADIEKAITKLYLEADIDKNKKEAITILLEHIKRDFQEYEKEDELKVRDWLKNHALNTLVKFSKRVSELENMKLLAELNYIAETYPVIPLYYFDVALDCYEKLIEFKKSKIDESIYYREKEALIKKAKELQRFSSKEIELDKIPNHPTDILSEFQDCLVYCCLKYTDKEADNVYDDERGNNVADRVNNKSKEAIKTIIQTLCTHTIGKNRSRLPKATKESMEKKRNADDLSLLIQHITKKDQSTLSDDEANQLKIELENRGIISENDMFYRHIISTKKTT